MFDSILADLGSPEQLTAAEPAAETPAIDAETQAEIDSIPEDEETAAPAEETGEASTDADGEKAKSDEETPEDSEEKPEIGNLSERRWKKVHAGYKYAQEIGKVFGVVAEDGKLDTSLLPSAEDLQQMRDTYADRLAMEQDFVSGDPKSVQQWIANWDQFDQNGMAAVAAQLPTYLAAHNPAAYAEIARPAIGRFIDYMYEAAAGQDDPQIQKYILDGARAAEWWATGGPGKGTFRDDDAIRATLEGRKVQTRSAADEEHPDTKALRELKQRESQQQWGGFMSVANKAIAETVNPEVERVLAPLEKIYPKSVMEGIRREFTGAYRQAIDKDTASKRVLDVAMQRARSAMDQQALDTIRETYVAMARRAIRAVAPAFVKERVQNFKPAVSDETRQQLQRNATKKAPVAGAGAAPPRSVMQTPQRKPGESADEFTARMMRMDMGLTV